MLLFDACRGREEQCLSSLEGMPMWGQLTLRWGGARSSLMIWGACSCDSPRKGRVPPGVPSQSLLIWGMWYTVHRPVFCGQSSVPPRAGAQSSPAKLLFVPLSLCHSPVATCRGETQRKGSTPITGKPHRSGEVTAHFPS